MSVVCAACCYMALVLAVMHLHNILYLFIFIVSEYAIFMIKKIGIDKLDGRVDNICVSYRGNQYRKTNSSKCLCLIYVFLCFVLYQFVSGLI